MIPEAQRTSFSRLLRRTLRHIRTQEEIFNGNRESISKAFLSRKSVLLWAIQSAPVYAAEYPRALATEYPNLVAHRFRRPAEADRFASELEIAA